VCFFSISISLVFLVNEICGCSFLISDSLAFFFLFSVVVKSTGKRLEWTQ